MKLKIPVSLVKFFVSDKPGVVDVLNEDVLLFVSWRRPSVCTNHVNLRQIGKRFGFD